MAASILKKAGKYLQNLGESVLSKQLEKQKGVADKNDEFGLQRFVTAQNTWNSYDVAVKELAAGRKRSHWIWFVLPMLARRIPIFFRLTADVAAVGVYVFLISIDLSGGAWFRGLALPILGWACVLVFLLSFLLRGGRRSRLSAIAMCIGTVGLMALGVEYCMDRFFRAAWQPTWSLVVVVIGIGLIIPLRVVRRVPSLREEARRRFNM